MESVWIANIVTGGAVVGLLAWFAKRVIEALESRIAKNEIKTAHLETNYNEKFKRVEDKINGAEQNIREHFNRRLDQTNEKLDKVINDKSEYRIQQGHWQGKIEEKLNQVVEHIKNGKP